MRDRNFLLWLRNRLIHVYKEDPNVDFISKLENIAGTIPAERETPNMSPSPFPYRGPDHALEDFS